jgi:hypothetical protein
MKYAIGSDKLNKKSLTIKRRIVMEDLIKLHNDRMRIENEMLNLADHYLSAYFSKQEASDRSLKLLLEYNRICKIIMESTFSTKKESKITLQ